MGEGLQCNSCVRSRIEEEQGLEATSDSCKACKLPIHVKNLVFDGEKNWHQRCFICRQCNISLVNQKYYEKAGEGLFCENCFLARNLPTCYACKAEITGEDGVKMESGAGELLTWHKRCLICNVCCQQVGLDNVVFKKSLFCKKCYIQSTLDTCDACNKLITGVGFGFHGKYWHDTCFGCDGCDTVFLDGKFLPCATRNFAFAVLAQLLGLPMLDELEHIWKFCVEVVHKSVNILLCAACSLYEIVFF